ncbi:2-succinyl-5-enolpyruvyl-6-hydroxy-3-cyclohexene-1-carboxylic-acid synthase [Crocinitomicaceae bacterium]|nr:2-succinyl-5-enolpyruvyl-6-hydroxy-3-cyclohexene-1-carboxylic-acid synthase [Crocinitomicaceae bacterium]
MVSSNKIGVQLIVQQCVSNGVKHVVFSPGSRNAPFIIAFDNHPEVETIVIHDERSAAFFAMGMAQQLKAPVAVVCTSGSAVLNYYPAVAEAYYQGIPLVVISADRPNEWIDQGDGQTIVQNNVFQNHVQFAASFSDKDISEEYLWFMERELSKGFQIGLKDWKGPIHFNMALSEPLYEKLEVKEITPKKIELISPSSQLSSSEQAIITKLWSESSKKLILCGQLSPDKILLEQLKELSGDTSVAILVENTSNLVHQLFVHCIDRTLNVITQEELEDYSPDLLITIGGAVVSKKIKSFFRNNKPKYHWKVGFDFPFMDTYQSLTHSFEISEVSFFNIINQSNLERNNSMFGSKWKQKDFEVQDKLPAFYESLPYCDLKVFETVMDYLPEMSHLHMANSSVVRYCQLFDPIQSIQYWSNRGTSGIDGSSSTAAGAAFVKKEDWNVLITGDISFFYDSNAFWNNNLTPNLRVFMINNDGGGIFKIIPGPSSTEQEKVFVAPHAFSAEFICKAFNLDYFKAESIQDIESQMEDFYTYEEKGRAKVMEVFTGEIENSKFLDDYFRSTK